MAPVEMDSVVWQSSLIHCSEALYTITAQGLADWGWICGDGRSLPRAGHSHFYGTYLSSCTFDSWHQ